MEYENTDRSGFHKYGRRIRGSESLSLPGSLITTHTTLHNRKIMGIIHLKHTGIKTTKHRILPFHQSGVIKITWRVEMGMSNLYLWFYLEKKTILSYQL